MTHLLLEYTLAADYLERRADFRAEHLALLEGPAASGEMLLAGALADPFDRSLFVWREDSAGAAEAFVAADPYVTHGLVTSWRIRIWNTAMGSALG